MAQSFLEKTVLINAPILKVWSVFTDPKVTKKMGGEYSSNWKVGGPFGWKGLDGNQLTNGTILQFQPPKLLKHNLFAPDKTTVISEITYELKEIDGQTQLFGREDFMKLIDNKAYAEASEGWDIALDMVKKVAEKLK